MKSCPLPAHLQCGMQPCPPRLLHQLYSFDCASIGGDTEQPSSSSLLSPGCLTSQFNHVVRSLVLLQARTDGSHRRLTGSLERLRALTVSTHSLWALQCIAHMQQVGRVAQHLHDSSIAAFAQHRDALVRALDVPLTTWTADTSSSPSSATASCAQSRDAPFVNDVARCWQQLTQCCESELDAAEEQLRVLQQVLAFCAPAAPACNDQGTQYVHLPVGILGWQDSRVQISWDQLCETGEQGEPLLAVGIACIGREHVELRSLWLSMHCRYTKQLSVRCYPLSSHRLWPQTGADSSSSAVNNQPCSLTSPLPTASPSSCSGISVVVPFDATRFDEDGRALPPCVAVSCSYGVCSDSEMDAVRSAFQSRSSMERLALPLVRWWRQTNHVWDDVNAVITPSEAAVKHEEVAERNGDSGEAGNQ